MRGVEVLRCQLGQMTWGKGGRKEEEVGFCVGDTYISRAVDFESKHAGGEGEVVGVVDGDAEVVGFCGGFGGGDVGCEGVVGGLPLLLGEN